LDSRSPCQVARRLLPAMPEVDEATRIVGKVTRFAAKRGFGFIKPAEGGKDVLVHWSQITSNMKWPRLERDMEVEYSPGTDDEGRKKAFNVTLEGGGDIDLEEESENRKLSTFRITGTVKFFAKAGYGFITTKKAITWPEKLPAGTDIYVSREDLEVAEDSLCRLRPGQEVEFNVYKQEDKASIAAANVTEPGGEAIIVVPKSDGAKKGNRKGKGKGKGKRDGKAQSVGVKKTVTKATPKTTARAAPARAAPARAAPATSVKKGAAPRTGKGGQSGKGKAKNRR